MLWIIIARTASVTAAAAWVAMRGMRLCWPLTRTAASTPSRKLLTEPAIVADYITVRHSVVTSDNCWVYRFHLGLFNDLVCLWITDDLRYIVQDNYHRLSERLEMHRSMSEPPADVRPAPEILSSLQEATTPNSTSHGECTLKSSSQWRLKLWSDVRAGERHDLLMPILLKLITILWNISFRNCQPLILSGVKLTDESEGDKSSVCSGSGIGQTDGQDARSRSPADSCTTGKPPVCRRTDRQTTPDRMVAEGKSTWYTRSLSPQKRKADETDGELSSHCSKRPQSPSDQSRGNSPSPATRSTQLQIHNQNDISTALDRRPRALLCTVANGREQSPPYLRRDQSPKSGQGRGARRRRSPSGNRSRVRFRMPEVEESEREVRRVPDTAPVCLVLFHLRWIECYIIGVIM